MADSAGDQRKRQALGRGLGALIPGAGPHRKLFFCPVGDLDSALDQPRTAIHPDTLSELAESIRQSGVLQPILVKRDGDRYRIIAGERRWRAAKMAGLERIPALVKQVEEDESFALALIENVQREDLTPLEEALAYRRLIDDHGYTQKTLAIKIGKARSTLANTLRLLDLPESVQQHVASGRLTAGHARAVLAVPPDSQDAFAREVLEKGLTVRQAELKARPPVTNDRRIQNKARSTAGQLPENAASGLQSDERRANLGHLEARMRQSWQTRVYIADNGGRGRVEVYYDDDEMLQEIIDRLMEGER